MTSRIAVFASGRGSNLQALHAHLAREAEHRIVLVASDRADSGALQWARAQEIRTATWQPPDDAPRMQRALDDAGATLVVLAGYLRLVPSEIVRAYRGRMLNVHPALLPAFGGKGMYGARVHRAVIDAGARVSGPTVHFVDEVYDHGAVIAQWPVPVFASDSEATLAARVLRAEHLLFPRVVHAVASGSIALGDDGRVTYAHQSPADDFAFLFSSIDDDALADSMALAIAR